MRSKRYRKKPVVIEAMRWEPDDPLNAGRLIGWIGASEGPIVSISGSTEGGNSLAIPTLEGTVLAAPGDWIIRGVKGEFYPCKPDIFDATYESAVSSGESK